MGAERGSRNGRIRALISRFVRRRSRSRYGTLPCVLLSKCPRNSRGRLVSIDVDSVYRLRLQELGLRPGARRCLRREGSVGLRAAREEGREVDATALGELAGLRPAGESIRQVHGIRVLAERR
ncbi:hypothetical protein HMPREF9241_00557 [Schaalia turicensis ACS-279-V-Col4]|uniref:Ferrous iron transporter FeoA domain-containing protein n=1 Tax=Schaalia turicensis ACS-279-V-Col4 TaxID=883077 RepID=K0YTY6_9ACTO|nr:hypothetical protein HMPREF9241_00557 [Schaalia turicensis ACS-279-V-Col4]